MSPPPAISRLPPGRGLDYDKLRSDALQFVQETAGATWTDFNEHDPGVTTLELLCFSLTELSYRATFPVTDILAGPDGIIDTRRQALYIPRRILPGEPSTINDYRKLLVDRVPGLGNAWFVPAATPQAVNGLYDILLYAPDADDCVCEGEPPNPLLTQALGVYARHRALCEDVRRATLLRPLRTIVAATAEIDRCDEPEAIAAELLYRAGKFLAPELRRRPIAEFMEQGVATSRIFEGPLLRNGFIADSELGAKAERIDSTELISVMASCPGVLSVNELTVRIGRRIYRAPDTIDVPRSQILRLDPGLDAKVFPIKLTRHGSLCRLDPNRVRQELTRRWRNHRRTYPLARDYQQAIAMPRGRHRDLGDYSSIQALYPETYGVGPRGLSADALPLRRAQARQLKGYLLVFEQLLADYLAQLAHARDLLSIQPSPDRSYFGQSLAAVIPDAGELLIDPQAIDTLRHDGDRWIDRRNRFLDLLLALYAEDASTALPNLGCNTDPGDHGEKTIEAKLGLLNQLAKATRIRGRGFDYLAETAARNVAGMEIKSRLQLEIKPAGDPAAAAAGEPTRKLYLVEHVLLRTARYLRGESIGLDLFDYAFTVSAVLHIPDAQGKDPGFRRQAATLLRANTPAHIVLLTRFLDAARLSEFEDLHAAWCAALQSRDPRDIVRNSVQLRNFLAQCPAEEDIVHAGGGAPS
jgi:hypothetical protein